MGCRGEVLEMRRRVMGVEIESVGRRVEDLRVREDDAFEGECYGVYIPGICVKAVDGDVVEEEEEDVKRRSKSGGKGRGSGDVGGVKSGKVEKKDGGGGGGGGGGRTRVMTSKADLAKYNERIRKYVRKYGWGNWKRIERSGKFPANYTARLIAKRAKAMKLDEEVKDGAGAQGKKNDEAKTNEVKNKETVKKSSNSEAKTKTTKGVEVKK